MFAPFLMTCHLENFPFRKNGRGKGGTKAGKGTAIYFGAIVNERAK
jgi:hypothetical protein